MVRRRRLPLFSACRYHALHEQARMSTIRAPWLAGLLAAVLCAAGAAQAQDAPRVRVVTSAGEFVVELEPERAPLTVANFLRYAREGFYEGTVFHRVIANFVIQGGGHAAADYAVKATHAPIANESGNGLANRRGTVGLARTEAPHSGTSQFYLNVADNPDLDPLPTRWGYAVFGRIVEGMDVVDRMSVVPTGRAGPFKSDAPLKPIVIERVEVLGDTRPD
jgi:peptidyl-prolyl cis-trans isomerase A (cyclophilin A)